MQNAHHLSALQAARHIESGSLTCEALTRACLDRIFQRNTEVHAFTAVDNTVALDHARRIDARSRSGRLHGIPFAVKDVFDTADYVTSYGSPIYAGHRPAADAACVAIAREQGALVLGKVATSEFATQTPSNTRNPLCLERTPGGSSSGSAAAVADFMVPVALGTQTTGSTIRPAVYCGIIGYKPSHGLLSTGGLKPLSPSQDTVGILAREVIDAAFFSFGMHGANLTQLPDLRPRIAVCLSNQWAYAKPETVAAIEQLAARAERAGASVTRVQLPQLVEELADMQPRLFAFEARQALAEERIHHWGRLSTRLQIRLNNGSDISREDYVAMRRRAATGRRMLAELLQDVDVLLYPAADGEAEIGIADSGSPRFGALWSLLQVPTVSFPITTGPAGMPLGAQVVGAFDNDLRTLACAQFLTQLSEYRLPRLA